MLARRFNVGAMAPPTVEGRRETMKLADGRVQTWSEFGPADGVPVLYLHGGNDCGLEGAWFADTLDADVRLIAPDRAGFGGTDGMPKRQLGDVAEDVHQLLDHLGLVELPVFGLSGGGPHVVALLSKSERFTRAAVVASPSEYGSPDFFSGMWFPIRIAYLVARHLPGFVVRLLQRMMNNAKRNMSYASRMPRPDALLLEGAPVRKERIIRSVTEAHRRGFAGAAQEWRLYTQPWGVDFDRVRVQVALWYGDQDGMAPPNMGRWLERVLPHAKLEVLEGEAHLSLIHRHAQRVVRELLGRSDGPRLG